jgi:hypothetical protein
VKRTIDELIRERIQTATISLDLLDKQINTLHQIEMLDGITQEQRDHISGLLNLLCDIYASKVKELRYES